MALHGEYQSGNRNQRNSQRVLLQQHHHFINVQYHRFTFVKCWKKKAWLVLTTLRGWSKINKSHPLWFPQGLAHACKKKRKVVKKRNRLTPEIGLPCKSEISMKESRFMQFKSVLLQEERETEAVLPRVEGQRWWIFLGCFGVFLKSYVARESTWAWTLWLKCFSQGFDAVEGFCSLFEVFRSDGATISCEVKTKFKDCEDQVWKRLEESIAASYSEKR